MWLCSSLSGRIYTPASLTHATDSLAVGTSRVMGLSPKAACRHEQTNGVTSQERLISSWSASVEKLKIFCDSLAGLG